MLRAFTQICVNMASRFFCFFISVGFYKSRAFANRAKLGFFELVISAIFAKEIAKRLKVWIIVCL